MDTNTNHLPCSCCACGVTKKDEDEHERRGYYTMANLTDGRFIDMFYVLVFISRTVK